MAYLYDLTDTWNAAGTVFNAIKMNVTNTASAAGSKIVSLQVGATDRFTVDKDGNGYFSGTLQAVGSITAPNVYIGANSGTIGMQDNTASILAYNGTGSGGITNTLRFITGAAERVRIDGSGNVGIGTTVPGQKLTVVGNIELFQGANRFIKLGSATNYNYTLSAVDDDFQILEAGTTPRLTIKYPNGNVGIGTSSPSVALQVQRSSANATIRIASSGGAGRDWDIKSQTDGYLTIGSDLLSNQLNLYAGNLGLGVTPSAWSALTGFDINAWGGVYGYTNQVGVIGNAYYNSGWKYKSSNYATYYSQEATGDHRWFTAPSGTAGNAISFTQAMTLDAYGNLDLGTTGGADRYQNIIATSAKLSFNAGTGFTGSAATSIYNQSAIPMVFGTNNTERMRLDASGNLGIGTTIPGSYGGRLVVGDPADTFSNNVLLLTRYATASFVADGVTAANGAQLDVSWANGGQGPLRFTFSGTERMRLDSSGNVGIGTSSPGLPLDVQSNASGLGIRIRGRAADSNGYLQFSSNNLASSSYIGSDGSSLRFDTSGSERARIDSSGSLLVGQSAGGFSNGNSMTLEPSAGYCVFNHLNGTASGTKYHYFAYNGGEIGSITQNGTTAVAYNTSSDYRLKDIAGPVQNSGAYIDALKPVQGSWKADGSRFIGLIAHEVQEVSETQIATGVKDGEEMQAMDYSAPELIANLIAEIQSLRARVAQLEGN